MPKTPSPDDPLSKTFRPRLFTQMRKIIRRTRVSAIGDGMIRRKLKRRSKSKRTRSNPEHHWNGKTELSHHTLSMKILVFALLSFFVSLIGFFIISQTFFVQKSVGGKAISVPFEPGSFARNASSEKLVTSIEETVCGFMSAESASARARFVLGGESMIPKMEEFYQRPGIRVSKGFARIKKMDPFDFFDVAGQIVTAFDETNKAAWIFNLVPGTDRMLIDWESSVGYSEMSWENLLAQKPTEPTLMRVIVKGDQILEEQGTAVLQIGIPGRSDGITAGLLLNSKQGRLLKQIVSFDEVKSMALRLGWNENIQAFEITELVHNSWIDLRNYYAHRQRNFSPTRPEEVKQ